VGNIAKWDGGTWRAMGSGTNGGISSFAFDGSGNLYAGGYFTTLCGTSARRIARWNGSSWSALANGINGEIASIVTDGSGNLYVGGRFDSAGSVAANHVAKWDGGKWSSLGTGVGGGHWPEVASLAIDGSGILYAGGSFDSAGGIRVNNIAKWDGAAWSPLGSGLRDYEMMRCVADIAIDKSGALYAGGGFKTAGEVAVNHIAKWDGAAWSPLDTGLIPYVSAMAIDDSGALYAGTAWDIAPVNISRWSGGKWSVIGDVAAKDYAPFISVLIFDGSGNLYAGGEFVGVGGAAAKRIARWDGVAWSGLGEGMNECVSDLAIDGSGALYAGGNFTTAGGKVSAFMAKCKIANIAVRHRQIGDSPQHLITFDSRSNLFHFHLQSATDVCYSVYTLTGKQIFHGSKFMEKGNNSLKIPFPVNGKIAPGTYIFQANAGVESARFRLIIKK
jgi:hypothetical protein